MQRTVHTGTVLRQKSGNIDCIILIYILSVDYSSRLSQEDSESDSCELQ